MLRQVRLRSRKVSLNSLFTSIVLLFLNNCKNTAIVDVLLVGGPLQLALTRIRRLKKWLNSEIWRRLNSMKSFLEPPASRVRMGVEIAPWKPFMVM
jgi:hypothetical protein